VRAVVLTRSSTLGSRAVLGDGKLGHREAQHHATAKLQSGRAEDQHE